MRYKPRTLDHARDVAIKKAYRWAEKELKKARGHYSPEEMIFWSRLETEARQYKLTGKLPSFLALEVPKKKVSEYVTRIISKADSFAAKRAEIVKKRRQFVEEVKAMTSIDEILRKEPGDE